MLPKDMATHFEIPQISHKFKKCITYVFLLEFLVTSFLLKPTALQHSVLSHTLNMTIEHFSIYSGCNAGDFVLH